MSSFSFPKSEKLKHKRFFNLLFAEGKSKYIYPVRMLWVQLHEPINQSPVLAGVTVPKKNFKKAHQRNRIKRQLREAYRKHKVVLTHNNQDQNNQLVILFIYSSKSFENFTKIEKAIKYLTKHLHKVLSQ